LTLFRKSCFQNKKASQPIRFEGIAGLEIAAFESKLEPTHPLGRTPMGKSVRDYVTLGLPLDPIIANRAGSVQSFLNVSGLKDLAAFIGLMSPNSCEAVSLQFHPHG
jgi:hypothetical protein